MVGYHVKYVEALNNKDWMAECMNGWKTGWTDAGFDDAGWMNETGMPVS